MFIEYHIIVLGKGKKKKKAKHPGYIHISSVFKKKEAMDLAAFISVYQRI